MTTQVTSNNITNNSITASSLASGLVSPKITSVAITDSSYNVLDDTAANTTGGYIQISGSNFTSTSQVVIGTNNATSVTYVNSAIIRAQVPAAAATSYPVYVIDTTTGATAIKINGLTQSSFPAWGTAATLANTAANTVFSVSLSANSDSNITYSNTSALPAGTSLLSNGYFYGTVTIGQQTTYSFDVKATDAELQDATRTFSLTVTVFPAYQLWVSGSNNAGVLGLNDSVSRSSPVQVGALTDWTTKFSFGKASDTILTVKNDGSLWAWGENDNSGVLGINAPTTAYRSSPVQVGAMTNWSSASTRTYQAYAIKTDGTLWAWGRNIQGELGLNDKVYRSSPVQVGSDTTWSAVSAMTNGAIAVKTDGTLWTWGKNDQGQLGKNDAVYRSSPVQVGAGTNWTNKINGNGGNVFAIKSDGTLWSWGWGISGSSGLNVATGISSPTQVGALTNWSTIYISYLYSVAATKTDGTLWTWGAGTNGTLGNNNTINVSSPIQIGSDTTWSQVSGGNTWFLGRKTNGTIWGWGLNNSYGQINIDKINRSSPTQIGALTTWAYIEAGYLNWIGLKT